MLILRCQQHLFLSFADDSILVQAYKIFKSSIPLNFK